MVEDNDDIRENVGELLRDEGYTCWLTASADDAYRLLQDAPRAPDVILLDYRLPGMRAERFLSLLKERAAWAQARVVLQTAALENELPAALPIDAFVSKPFGVEQLLATIRRLIRPRAAEAPDRDASP